MMKRKVSSMDPMVNQVNEYLSLLARAKRFHEGGMRLDALNTKRLDCAQSDLKCLATIYQLVEKQGNHGGVSPHSSG
jgi:hypothetical protein